MRKSKKYSIVNVGSFLLNTQENQKIFQLLGDGCTTKSTAIIQLYGTQSPDHNRWFKLDTGVLCLVRDANFKKYFFRLYCFESNTFLWEFCIPPGFEYVESTPFLQQFYGPNCVFGFNFADENEARIFGEVVKETVKTIKVPKQSQREKKPKKQQSVKIKKVPRPVISNPVDFRHIQHYGFSEWKGLDTEIGRLSGKVQNVPEETVIPSTTTVNQLTEQIETLKIKDREQVYHEDPLPPTTYGDYEQNTEPPQVPQSQLLSDLVAKFETKKRSVRHSFKPQPQQILEKEINHGAQEQNAESHVHQEDDNYLREAIITRQRAFHDEEDDDEEFDDDDEWD